jgi:hypothetical protein
MIKTYINKNFKLFNKKKSETTYGKKYQMRNQYFVNQKKQKNVMTQ